MEPRRRLSRGLLDIVSFSDDFTLGPDNNEQFIQATAGITITLPNDLPQGFACIIEQAHASDPVILEAAANATLVNGQDFDRTAGQYALCTLCVRTNTTGRNAEYLLGGDGATA